jgi:hypothetical protein
MQVTLNINSEQLIEAASKMPLEDKLKLYDKIKDDIFEIRFKDILKSLKTDKLSDEEILQAVEHVRSERYKNRS